ncbi:hypothetical protein H2Y56_14470 [Pectobacterium aroidearum]|uniref:Uncharacterized protein n=2 Tax=Pectobacterium TaxID=122277 RepID=A0A8B3FCQ7_PECPM|nr:MULTISPECIES: hypothetical protein [Pectobacterium]KHS86787.1 hypothetical protein RC83_13765 [Pectobacterium brasiliense]MBA5200512.1 hypothetical protein [Pectobacterium aroidearum]MBA5233304.1 hypothetical protein [Pectobacterium aroidearum]RKO76190.1 hypothetical protein C5E00_05035 [Pectobacterium parmentieri]
MSATNKAQVMATLTNERLEEIASGKGCIPLTVEAQQMAHENLFLRTQLAELGKQKPVAWTNADNLFDVSIGHAAHIAPRDENTYRMPLYASPVVQALQPYTTPDEVNETDDMFRKLNARESVIAARWWNACRSAFIAGGDA